VLTVTISRVGIKLIFNVNDPEVFTDIYELKMHCGIPNVGDPTMHIKLILSWIYFFKGLKMTR